jgi:hypothetical protein
MSIDQNTIATGSFAVAAAIATGFFTWLAAGNSERLQRYRDRNAHLSAKYRRALEQIEAFHSEEGLFASELEMLGSDKPLAVKTEFRDRVVTAGFTRPTMTAGEARNAIEELDATPV